MIMMKEKTTKENWNQKRKYKRKKEKDVYVISTYILLINSPFHKICSFLVT
jgi:hypothetical protein